MHKYVYWLCITEYSEILYWSFFIKTKSIWNTYQYFKMLYWSFFIKQSQYAIRMNILKYFIDLFLLKQISIEVC